MNGGFSIRTSMVLLLGLVMCATQACTPVKPWQRGYLAKPEMQGEIDFLDAKMDAHTYASKEGSSGGASAQGGGCGCN